jgi:hypothetical protein
VDRVFKNVRQQEILKDFRKSLEGDAEIRHDIDTAVDVSNRIK